MVHEIALKWLNAILDTLETNDTWYPKTVQFINRYKKKIESYYPYHIIVALMAIIIFIFSFHNTVQMTKNDVPISSYKIQNSFMPFNITNELYNCNAKDCAPIIDENWIHYMWLAVSSGLLLSMMISIKYLAYPWILLMKIYCVLMISKFGQILGFDKAESVQVFVQEIKVIILFVFYYLAAKLALKTIASEEYEEVSQEGERQSSNVNDQTTSNDAVIV
jgi:hypothetical protein